MAESLLEKYRRLLANGKVAPDTAQALAVEKLQMLTNRLVNYTPPARTDFFTFFTRRRGEIPKGLYIYGAVGRGKTMLMDLFFGSAQVWQKRRGHFHEFMADVHARLAIARREAKEDPAIAVARAIAAEARLLCLDELFVIDIADATILSRLFAAIFAAGTIVVVTSNAHPAELYKDGRNRDLFLPFIDLVQENMELLQLEASRDYRLEHLAHSSLYFCPLGPAANASMDDLWSRLTFGEQCGSETLHVLGHELAVPRASFGAARFEFADLFEKPLGAADYIALARHYHTVFIDGIRVMGREQRNEARRFITFIDTLYDHHTGLIASAEAEPEALYRAGDGAEHFERTASRLTEMRQPRYLTETLGGRNGQSNAKSDIAV
jgi:cell division protein ZapE